MKRQLLLLLIAFAFSRESDAQKFYYSFNAGFAVPFGRADNYQGSDFKFISNNETRIEAVFYSLGKGPKVSGAFGFMLRENLALELDISYLYGLKTYSYDRYPDVTDEYSEKGNLLTISPNVVLFYPLNDKNRLYSKIGLLTGMSNAEFKVKSSDNQFKVTQEFSGGFNLGFHGGLGLELITAGKARFFAEADLMCFSYTPARAELTEMIEDGNNELPNMSVIERETEFSENTSYNTDFPDMNKPRQSGKIFLPFNNISLNAGIRFYIN